MADAVMAVIRASRPKFRNNHDIIAFAVHASFMASGHVLMATGPPAFANDALSSSSTDEVGIDGWNELDDEYAFLYVRPENLKKRVLVKCVVVSDKFIVDAISKGRHCYSSPGHLEIDIGDHVSENGGPSYSAQYKKFSKLVDNLNKQILDMLKNWHPAHCSTIPPPVSDEPLRLCGWIGSTVPLQVGESPLRLSGWIRTSRAGCDEGGMLGQRRHASRQSQAFPPGASFVPYTPFGVPDFFVPYTPFGVPDFFVPYTSFGVPDFHS